MGSPGGSERGRISIRVVPDSSDFPGLLHGQLREVEKRHKVRIGVTFDRRGLPGELQTLARAIEGAVQVKIPVQLDLRPESVAAAVRSLPPVRLPAELDAARLRTEAAVAARRASGSNVAFGVDLDRAAFATAAVQIGKLAAGILAFGARSAAFKIATPAVLGLASALGQAAGSAALLPGVFAIAGVAAATAAVGFKGFGDALKNVGDPAKFAEALGKLAPNAQATAIAFRDLGPSFAALRMDVQNRLFAGMAEQISALGGRYAPVLRSGMTGVADAMNVAGKQAVGFAGNAQTVADTSTLFANVQRAIQNIAQAIAPALSGLRDLGTVGSTVAADLTGGLGGAAERFAAFMAQARESGALEQFLRAAVATLQQFGSILGNVGSILVTVLSAGSSTGQSILGVLDRLTESIATFLKSTEGQAALTSFFQVASAAGGALLAVFTALQPAIRPLLGIVSTLATSAFGALTTILTSLAGVVSEVVIALEPFAQKLGGALLQVAEKLGPALTSIATAVAGVLLSAFQALEPHLPTIVTALTEVATIASGLLTTALQTLAPLFPELTSNIQVLAPNIPLVAGALAELLVAILPLIPSLIKLAVAIIPALAANMKFMVTVISSVASVVLEVLVPVLEFLIDVVTAVVTEVASAFTFLTEDLLRTWSQTANNAATAWSRITSTVSGLAQRAVDALRNAWNSAVAFVQQAWSAITNAVSSGVGGTVSLVAQLPGRILSALGNFGSLLYNAGRDLISGLINGIGSMISAAVNKVRDVGRAVTNAISNVLGIRSPSRVFMKLGRDTAAGFVIGISDGVPLAQAAANDLASAAMFSPPTSSMSGRSGGNTINVYPRAEQSEWSIATQVDRALAFAGRA